MVCYQAHITRDACLHFTIPVIRGILCIDYQTREEPCPNTPGHHRKTHPRRMGKKPRGHTPRGLLSKPWNGLRSSLPSSLSQAGILRRLTLMVFLLPPIPAGLCPGALRWPLAMPRRHIKGRFIRGRLLAKPLPRRLALNPRMTGWFTRRRPNAAVPSPGST